MIKKIILYIFSKLGFQLVKKSYSHYEYLLKIPRYTQQTISLLNKSFLISDSHSFYYSFDEIFHSRIYEFRTDVQDPFIIDCGANVGTSILFFKSILPEAKILAFEADPNIYDICKKNINNYQLTNVTLNNIALWNENTEINFNKEGADGGRLDLENSNDTSIQVKAHKLSSFMDQKIHFLKIDIEGAEIQVIPEIKHKLHLVEKLFIEFHSFVNSSQKLSEILSILEEEEFRYNINTQMCSAHPFIKTENVLGMDNQLNIFAFR